MKPQEDIGGLIKTKLQSAERTSNEPTWERIQNSLEERKKKRRFAFYIKLGSVVLLFMISAVFILTYTSTNTENTVISQEEIHPKSDHQNVITIETNKEIKKAAVHATATSKNNEVNPSETSYLIDQEITEENSITPISKRLDTKTKKEDIEDKTVVTENKKNTPQAITSEDIKKIKVLDTIVNRNDVPVTQTTQKVYYYYNSKNGQEVRNTDKKVIDSIVAMNQRKQDSLKSK